MKGNVISVVLWGYEVCRIIWKGGYKERFGKVGSEVTFNPDFCRNGWDLDPLGMYSISKYLVRKGLSDYFRASSCEGLPRFMCGSLPDSWGNKVFSSWVKEHRIRSSEINAVDKLSFIGKRGMGALEFIPQSYSPETDHIVELDELYALAREISVSKEAASVDLSSNPGINDLMAVGMSAGGQHPKAIVAIDWERKEVRSGQFIQPANYKQYILKFREDNQLLSAEVEYSYYLMATDCGIEIMPSRLFEVSGINHFLTERFDRKEGSKIHTATLFALCGETSRYEDLFKAARALKLPYIEMEQLFRRAVFNYMAYICDDHDRNVSFMMDRDGRWHLAPAYDLTFSVDFKNPFIGPRHAMELGGSNEYEGPRQLLNFGRENDIRNAAAIIEEIGEVINKWPSFAQQAGVDKNSEEIIGRYLLL